MDVIYLPRDPSHEFVKVKAFATVEKRTQEYDERVASLLARGFHRDVAVIRAGRDVLPYEVVVGDYNALVDAGINAMLLLLVGGGGTAFNSANAYIGVGAATTAWAASQTNLITTPTRKAMKSAAYPETGSKKMTFASDFLTAEANIAWNEWAIFNAASGGTMLNRKVETGLGTKSSGTWTISVEISLV
jgi:hypothetical protein